MAQVHWTIDSWQDVALMGMFLFTGLVLIRGWPWGK